MPVRPLVAARRRLFRRSYAQVEAYAAAWHRSNEQALAADGPLWLVLGDSAAQAVGASAHDRGYVGVVHARLRAVDDGWQVLNLSRSGARTADVVDEQLPRARAVLAGRRPHLVTAVVGGNDALGTRRGAWRADVDRLVGALPERAVVATVARGLLERRTAPVNAHLRRAAAARGLLVADLWAVTGPPYRGRYADGLHPNDLGYEPWADEVWRVVQQALDAG